MQRKAPFIHAFFISFFPSYSGKDSIPALQLRHYLNCPGLYQTLRGLTKQFIHILSYRRMTWPICHPLSPAVPMHTNGFMMQRDPIQTRKTVPLTTTTHQAFCGFSSPQSWSSGRPIISPRSWVLFASEQCHSSDDTCWDRQMRGCHGVVASGSGMRGQKDR